MGWRLVGKPETKKATKSIVANFMKIQGAPGDRPLSERRLQVYHRIYNQGGFRPVTWATAYCKETGSTYRVNGQHTSIMLSGMEEYPHDFYIVFEHYECDTLADVAQLYSTFDSKTQSRNSHEINISFASTVPEFKGFPLKTFDLAVAGIGYAKWREKYWGKPLGERAELLLEYSPFVLWLNDILSTCVGEKNRPGAAHLRRSPVVAAMFDTYETCMSDATKFWQEVRDETGKNPNVPDRKLAKWLTITGANTGVGRTRKIKHAGNREFYAKCIKAWNDWRGGEPTTDLRYFPDKPLPKPK